MGCTFSAPEQPKIPPPKMCKVFKCDLPAANAEFCVLHDTRLKVRF